MKNNSIQRALQMLFRADAAWREIAEEKGGIKEAIFPYLVVVGLVPALAGAVFFAFTWGAMATAFGSDPAAGGIYSVLLSTVTLWAYKVVGILVTAKIAEYVAPSFNLKQDWVLSTRAIVYGSTPGILAAVFGWLPLVGSLIELIGFLMSIRLTLQGLKILLAQPVTVKSVTPVSKAERRESEPVGV